MSGDGRFAWTGALALMLALLVCGVAEARVTVKATLKQSGARSRLVVTIANTGRFTTRNKPRGVTVKYRRTTYRLSHMARTATSRSGQTSGWQTGLSAAYNGLARKRVAVSVRTVSGTASFLRTVVVARPAPRRDLSVDEAFQRIKPYFVNSRFTDCPQGGCPQEHRYDHCAGGGMDGQWQYHEIPSLPGSDASGPYHILDARYHADGSWSVHYRVDLPTGVKVFGWSVSPDGSVIGGWASENGTGVLMGYHWQQPAGC